MKTLPIQFLCPPIVSIADLIRKPTLLLKPLGFTKTQANLSYDPRAPGSYGQFKIARPGTVTPPVFGTNPKVCLKQCFFVHPETRERVIYDSARQAEQLTTELNCIGWGSALMASVYDFIASCAGNLGPPPFDVPQMCFVQCGLALDTGNDRTAFLLEEHIDATAANGSWFVKYVNNSSAKPRVFSNAEKTRRAEFLSFAQHVQFWKTNGLAFVSDFQGAGQSSYYFLWNLHRFVFEGGPMLLTDPQIITHPLACYLIILCGLLKLCTAN